MKAGSLQPSLPLAHVVWTTSTTLRNILLVVVGSLLLWVSAKVQIPFFPVPLTLQTMAIFLIGAAYGWRLAAATVALYLAQGAVGLPVFAGTPERGIGLAYMVGPTAGYLIGFLFATTLMGWLSERGWGRRVWTCAVAAAAAATTIYTAGALWLGLFLGYGWHVFEVGVTPFLYGEVLKVIVVALLIPLAWQVVDRRAEKERST